MIGMEQQPGLAVDAAPPWDRPIVTAPAFALLSAIGGLFPSFSVMANVYVMVLGGAMVAFGLSGRAVKRRSPWRLTREAAWWLVPAGLFVAFELTDFLFGSTHAHPTLSVLADPALEHYSIRALAYFAWLGAFWGLVRR